jgi:hypothetical protein
MDDQHDSPTRARSLRDNAHAREHDTPALDVLWGRWMAARAGAPTDLAERALHDALEAAPTSEILALYIAGVEADVRAEGISGWREFRVPLAAELDRRIPRRRP